MTHVIKTNIIKFGPTSEDTKKLLLRRTDSGLYDTFHVIIGGRTRL